MSSEEEFYPIQNPRVERKQIRDLIFFFFFENLMFRFLEAVFHSIDFDRC